MWMVCTKWTTDIIGTKLMADLPQMPTSVAKLPRDSRGLPVPWFVAWIDGKPDFRVADGRKVIDAIENKLCWVCGEKLSPSQHTFVVGPMCSLNHITSEPPCHHACAVFSAKACPFLNRQEFYRREKGMPENAKIGVSESVKVTLLWTCCGYQLRDSDGILFNMPNPSKVDWYCEGRIATRQEIIEAIDASAGRLKQICNDENDPTFQSFLKTAIEKSHRLVPVN